MKGGSTGEWREVFAAYDRLREIDGPGRNAEIDRFAAEHPQLVPRLQTLIRTRGPLDFLEQKAAIDPLLPSIEPGSILGPYRIEAPLGAGGMGEVWLARRDDGLFEAPVALKLLHAHLAMATVRERFIREGRILGQLSHPNVARLLDAGQLPDGRLYLAIEYVEGERLDRWCDERRVDVRGRLALFRQVCEAVSHAHARLIVHRDLKPSNILVTPEGDIKLLDFGIAKLIDGTEGATAEATELTRIGGRVLTPEYAAPEQLRGEPITVATDVYTLGVILHLLLAGRRPYGPDSTTATIATLERAILESEPTEPSAARGSDLEAIASLRGTTPRRLRQRLRGDLDTIVLKALKKAPAKRYATVEALAEDVRRHLDDEPLVARPDSAGYRFRKYVRRHRTLLGSAAAVFVALLAGLGATLLQARETRRQADTLAQRSQELSEVVAFQGRMLERIDVARFGQRMQGDLRQRIDDALVRTRTPEPQRQERLADFDGLMALSEPSEVARRSLSEFLLSPAAEELAGRTHLPPGEEASMRSALAGGYRALGEYKEALPQAERAVQLREQALGRDDPATVQAAFDRIETFRRLGDNAAAAGRIGPLALGLEARFGAEHPLTLHARTMAIAVLTDRREFAQAEAQARALLPVVQRVEGVDADDALWVRHAVASSIYGAGRFAESVEPLMAIYHDEERVYGEQAERTLKTGANVVLALNDSGRLDEAIALGRRVLDLTRRRYGRDHDMALDAQRDLSNALYAHGDLRESLELDREVVDTSRRRLGPENPDTLMSEHNLAESLMQVGDYAQAQRLLEEVYAVRVRSPGPDDQMTLGTQSTLGAALLAQGDIEGGRKQLADALARLTRTLGAQHSETLTTRAYLAEAAWLGGDRRRARDELEDIAQKRIATSGADHFRTIAVVTELVHVLRRMNDGVGADQWLARVPGAKAAKAEWPD